MLIPESAALRAYTKYTASDDGCFISTYSVSTHGYAQVGWGNKRDGHSGTTAHRAAWTHVNGQIPDGMTIDHTCKNRRCVNVDHLRMLTNYENARRTAGRDWPLGECVNGHPNSELVVVDGGRIKCGICNKAARRRWEIKNHDKRMEAQRIYRARKKAS